MAPGRSAPSASHAAPAPATRHPRHDAPSARPAASGCAGWWRCRRRRAGACRQRRLDAGETAPARQAPAGARIGEAEGRRARPGALDPHRAAHQLRQALADRQAQPVPPYLRVVDESAWLKLWNSRVCRPSGGRPMPVSRTANSAARRPRVGGRPAHGEHDLAALGELDRIGEQVEQHLAQPRHVAPMAAGTSPSNT